MVRLLSYLLELFFVALVWRALGRVFQSLLGGANPSSSSARNTPRNAGSSHTVHGETARDPVCGMFVSTELTHRLSLNGKMLHFCSRECLETYEKQRAEARD